VIQVTEAGAKADGYVIVNGTFTTNNQTTDNVKKWSLRSVLAAHAPDQLEKLAFGTHPARREARRGQLRDQSPYDAGNRHPDEGVPAEEQGERDLLRRVQARRLHRRRSAGSCAGSAAERERSTGTCPSADGRENTRTSLRRPGPRFCKLFPSRFFYVDSTRGLSAGFPTSSKASFRDDVPLCRSVLSDAEKAELDSLWAELYFATGIWEKMLRGFRVLSSGRSETSSSTPDFDSFKEEDPELVKDETLVRFKEVYLKRAGVKLTGDELAKHPISVFFRGCSRRAEVAGPATLKRAETAVPEGLARVRGESVPSPADRHRTAEDREILH